MVFISALAATSAMYTVSSAIAIDVPSVVRVLVDASAIAELVRFEILPEFNRLEKSCKSSVWNVVIVSLPFNVSVSPL